MIGIISDSSVACLSSGSVSEAGRCAARASISPPSLRSAGRHFVQALLTLVCLPYEAFFSLDAIVRTIWRMLVHAHATAGMESVERPGSRIAARTWSAPAGSMWIGPVIAAATAIYLTLSRAGARLVVAVPILGLWFASPAIAWWISRPLDSPRSQADGRPDDLSPEACPKDLGVLRDLRRSGRSLAAT